MLGYNASARLLDSSIKNKNIDTFGRYLLNELNRLEFSFCEYLREQVSSSNFYNEKADRLLNILTSKPKTDIEVKTQSTRKIYYLNFNYTLPSTKQLNRNGTNVHGYIGEKEDNDEGNVIIGIDQEQINDNNMFEYLFTKTYRKLFLKENFTSQPLPPISLVRRIVFFGHSLGSADYSYFRSIFDYYNIESSDIELVFYYSIYCEKIKEEIAQKHFKDVYNLLIDYSGKTNKNSGKNLIHRLLLEHRLRIIEVAEH